MSECLPDFWKMCNSQTLTKQGFFSLTSPKINMPPEKGPFQKEINHLPTIFGSAMLVFGLSKFHISNIEIKAMGPHVAALFVSPEILTVEGFPELVGAIAEDFFFSQSFVGRWKTANLAWLLFCENSSLDVSRRMAGFGTFTFAVISSVFWLVESRYQERGVTQKVCLARNCALLQAISIYRLMWVEALRQFRFTEPCLACHARFFLRIQHFFGSTIMYVLDQDACV